MARQQPDPKPGESPGRATSAFVAAAPASTPAGTAWVSEPAPAPAVSAETTALLTQGTSPLDTRAVAPEQDDAVPATAAPAGEISRPEPAKHDRTLHLRIVRDSEHCPVTVCYKWRLVEQRVKLPHHPSLDMARLRLAPSIREAAERGQIELMIDAVEQHRTVNGHDTVTIVATTLAGVMPHDRQ